MVLTRRLQSGFARAVLVSGWGDERTARTMHGRERHQWALLRSVMVVFPAFIPGAVVWEWLSMLRRGPSLPLSGAATHCTALPSPRSLGGFTCLFTARTRSQTALDIGAEVRESH